MTGSLNLSNVSLNATGASANIVGQASSTASGFFGSGYGITNILIASAAFRISDNSVFTTTLQTDNQLTLTLVAGGTYFIEAFIHAIDTATAGAGPDFKFSFSAPSASTMTVGYHASNGTTNAFTYGILEPGNATDDIAINSCCPAAVWFTGMVEAGSAGNLSFRFAQLTSKPNDPITLKRGSWLKVSKQ